MYATRHIKTAHGWQQDAAAPINSPAWDDMDREWMQWLIEHGETVLTVGHTMYEITTPKGE